MAGPTGWPCASVSPSPAPPWPGGGPGGSSPPQPSVCSAGWRRRSSGLRAQRRRQLARSEAIAVWAEMLRDLLVSNAGLHEAIGKSARVAPAAIRDEVQALYVRAQRGDLSAALAALRRRHGRRHRRHRRHRAADRRPAGRLRPRRDARRGRRLHPRDRRHAAADQRGSRPHLPHRAADRRDRRLLRGHPRDHQPRVHGAVRHGHRSGGAGRRCVGSSPRRCGRW